MIRFITDPTMKTAIARAVLEALTEWFEVEESREDYIAKAASWPMFAAFADGTDDTGEAAPEADKAIGFLCLKSTGPETVELAVMGVLKDHHREGVGRRLFAAAKDYAVQQGFSFFQVKTVATGMYEDYDKTNYFYQSLGFKELEVFNEIWGEENPCQIYVMSLKSAIDTIGTRHSYRGAFADEKVPREDLEIIARAGIDAPSGCNKQTTDIVVVDDPEVLSKIKETIDPPVAQTAPAMIVVLTRRINATETGVSPCRIIPPQSRTCCWRSWSSATRAAGTRGTLRTRTASATGSRRCSACRRNTMSCAFFPWEKHSTIFMRRRSARSPSG